MMKPLVASVLTLLAVLALCSARPEPQFFDYEDNGEEARWLGRRRHHHHHPSGLPGLFGNEGGGGGGGNFGSPFGQGMNPALGVGHANAGNGAQATGVGLAQPPPGGFGLGLGIGLALSTPFGNIALSEGEGLAFG